MGRIDGEGSIFEIEETKMGSRNMKEVDKQEKF